jgi:hypothetical protein
MDCLTVNTPLKKVIVSKEPKSAVVDHKQFANLVAIVNDASQSIQDKLNRLDLRQIFWNSGESAD